ncbi:histidine phosphatase family protein [Bacillus nitroreducens]
MELTLIRHLQTEWNKRGVLQGSKDIPILDLDETVLASIEKNKQKLKQKYSIILTSTLTRTQQTAVAYGYHDFAIDPLLNELDFGMFEGKAKNLLIETHKKEWFTNPSNIELGERIADLGDRILTFLQKYKDHESILVFGHGSWIRACVSYLKYGTIDKMNQIEIKNNQLLTIKVREEEYEIGRHHI